MAKFSLKAARVNKGLSQKSAAAVIGVSNKTLSSWENGITTPTVDKIPVICALYDVPYDQLNFLPDNPV